MAHRTIGGKIPAHVIRTDGRLVVALVASVAVPGQTAELVVHVAADADSLGMGAIERKAALPQVIEDRILPAHLIMTDGAIGRKSEHGVLRRGGGIISIGMTTEALAGSTDIAAGMTTVAVGLQMGPAQLELLGMGIFRGNPAHR